MQGQAFHRAAEIIAPLAPQIEASRGLPKEALDALVSSGVFALAIPRVYGGGEASITTLIDALETIARADGSAGWLAMIVSTSGTMSMLIDDAEAKAIYGKGAITCGVTAPMGMATKVDGGYRVTGRWPFASGCEIATHRMGGAIVPGEMLPNGMPDLRCMLFDASQTRIHDTWKTSGLRGTGSHDIEVEDAFVPFGRSFSLVTTTPRRASGVCAMPFFGMLATSVTAVAIGIARGALDAFVDLAVKKQPLGAKRTIAHRELVQNDVSRADALIRSAHASLIESANVVERDATVRARAELRATCVQATKCAAEAVDLLYDAAGASAIYDKSPLQRHFRDVHVATQHIMVAPAQSVLAGRILLGIESDTTLL
jgi:alkylation response protein AidB-like acyl-CoA dehydrogenase